MKTSRSGSAHRPPRWVSLLAGAVLALSLAPAMGDEHGRNEAPRGNSAQHRGGEHRHRDRHGYVQGNYYPQPVYVPPVVQYVPPQSPGISLFVPLDIHLR
jgi:hypothetical protein